MRCRMRWAAGRPQGRMEGTGKASNPQPAMGKVTLTPHQGADDPTLAADSSCCRRRRKTTTESW